MVERIGARIKRARTRAGLSQEDLGKAVHRSQESISAYERGEVGGVTIDTLRAIARATGAPIEELLVDVQPDQATLAEVLRRRWPDMDAGTIETLEKLAEFLHQRYVEDAARRQGSGRSEISAGHGSESTSGTPEERLSRRT